MYSICKVGFDRSKIRKILNDYFRFWFVMGSLSAKQFVVKWSAFEGAADCDRIKFRYFAKKLGMIFIYTDKITKRKQYIFSLIFDELLGHELTLSTDRAAFETYKGCKFSYGSQALDGELFFEAHGLLNQSGIRSQEVKLVNFQGQPALFPVYDARSIWPFDPFAAAFYLVTRYEEYLPYIRDVHGRFSARESLAYQSGFLKNPLVNCWAQQLGQLLMEQFPGFQVKEQTYRFVPTIDIDAAYSYLYKGVFRMAGGLIRDLVARNWNDVAQRLRVMLRKEKDPFDTYGLQLELQKKYRLKPIYFILFADYGLNDKNIPVHNRAFQGLIKKLADYAKVGIHPSYNSWNNIHQMEKEVERLAAVLKREITVSRQHFLRLSLPDTYRNLLNLNITDDYTMGYASEVGFRASICSSFRFYDLDMESVTPLRIHPFAVMEGTLKDYMGLGPEAAMTEIKPLIDAVKAVNGTFISLWHNETLSDQKRWIGWAKVYEEMIQYALPKTKN